MEGSSPDYSEKDLGIPIDSNDVWLGVRKTLTLEELVRSIQLSTPPSNNTCQLEDFLSRTDPIFGSAPCVLCTEIPCQCYKNHTIKKNVRIMRLVGNAVGLQAVSPESGQIVHRHDV